MAFGVTAEGFIPKRLEDIREETFTRWQQEFGQGFALADDSPEGQIKGILDERESLLWELGEAVSKSYIPSQSSDTQLDNVMALSGLTRKGATKSIIDSGRARGTFGTSIPIGTIISVLGNDQARFVTTAPASISNAAVDEVQALGDQGEADSGDITIDFNGETTGTISAPLAAGAIQTALEALPSVSVGDVAVAGVDAVNEVQTIGFSNDPDGGSFQLVFGEGTTAAILFSDNAAAVKSKIEAVLGADTVRVAGVIDNATGLTITYKGTLGGVNRAEPTFQSNTLAEGVTATVITIAEATPGAASTLAITFQVGLGGADQPLITIASNTMTFDGTGVNVTPSETTMGDVPKSDLIPMEAEVTGPTAAPAGSLTVIETPVSGMDSFTNETDADLGRNEETDAEAKLRREQSLQIAGAATPDAIRADLLAVEDVTAVVVFENDTDITDIEGRPPHSLDIVVQGGADQEIGDALWDTRGGGIRTIGDIAVTVVDSQGFNQTVRFSRPTEIAIHVIVNVTKNSDYPTDGDSLIQQAIIDNYESKLSVGDDVVVLGSDPSLACSFQDVPGMDSFTILVGTAPSPTASDNIPIAPREIADFDTSRITVNS